MMYTKKPNHIGISLGTVVGYNSNKGYVKVKLNKSVSLGDSIAIGDSSCKISELMIGNTNIKNIEKGDIATIGRIYGDIKCGDNVSKTVSINLNKQIDDWIVKENIKRALSAVVNIKINEPISIEIEDKITGIKIKSQSIIEAKKADNMGITKERIKEQLSKTGNTIFKFEKIDINIEENVVIPISTLNELRRNVLEKVEETIKQHIKRNEQKSLKLVCPKKEKNQRNVKEVNLCLNRIDASIDYTKIKDVNNIYIPFRFFTDKLLDKTVDSICKYHNTYIVFPTITKGVYEKLIEDNISKLLDKNIKGFVISNISQLEYVKNLDVKLIANYTMNVTNNYTVGELKKFGFKKIVMLPELNKQNIKNIDGDIKKEVIAYGRTLLMTSEYCMIGSFKNCKGLCTEGTYKIKDRLGFEFPVYTDKTNCNNFIYNSKITSIKWDDLNIDSIRIDILEENLDEINNIIQIHRKNEKLEGKDYTNGNLNKEI